MLSASQDLANILDTTDFHFENADLLSGGSWVFQIPRLPDERPGGQKGRAHGLTGGQTD